MHNWALKCFPIGLARIRHLLLSIQQLCRPTPLPS